MRCRRIPFDMSGLAREKRTIYFALVSMARRCPVCLICSGLVLVSVGLVCLDQFRSGLLLCGLVCPARFGFVLSHVVCSSLLGSDLPGPIWFAVVWSGLVWSLVIDLVCLVWFCMVPSEQV